MSIIKKHLTKHEVFPCFKKSSSKTSNLLQPVYIHGFRFYQTKD